VDEHQAANRDLAALTEEQCLGYLRAGHIGRVGLVVAGRTQILPVNYAADDNGRVVFRTSASSVLNEVASAEVTFEIDGADDVSRTGWTVQLFGRGQEITRARGDDAATLRELPVEPWATDRTAWYLLTPNEIIGRALVIRSRPDHNDEGWFAGIPSS